MFKEQIMYIKDNPNKYWFKRKLYGWGWTPATWQGLSITLVYVAFIFTLIISKEKGIPGNPDSGSNFLTLALPIIVSTTLFVYIAHKKGEQLKWQWGLPKETKNNEFCTS